jgi:hypothetical protein
LLNKDLRQAHPLSKLLDTGTLDECHQPGQESGESGGGGQGSEGMRSEEVKVLVT